MIGPPQLAVTAASETDTDTNSTTFSGNDVTGFISTSAHDVDTLSRPEGISDDSSSSAGSKYSLTTADSVETANSITGSFYLTESSNGSFSNYDSNSDDGLATTATELGTSSGSATRSGNSITGSYTLSETSHASSTVTENDVVGSVTTSATTYNNDTSSISSSGNEITGAASTSTIGSSAATMLKIDSYGSGDADNQSITSTGTSSSYQSGNDITGSFSLSDSSSETVSTTETGTRQGNTFTATSTDTSTATSRETGNSITGSIGTSETTTDSTGLTDTGSSSSGGYTTTQIDLSTAAVTGNENTITGAYTHATSSNDSTSVHETSSLNSTSYTLASTEITSAAESGSESGDTVTGAYSSSSTESDSTSLTQAGTNSGGNYLITATTSETSAIVGETGNTIGGDYTFSETATQNYSFNEANSTVDYSGSGSSFAIAETGTKAFSLTQTGSHVTGNYSLRESGTDSYTIAESGGTSSGYGGGGGSSGSYSSSSSSSGSSSWGLTLAGADNYTIAETGNELSGAFNRTTMGSGSDTLSEGGSLATTYYNHSPSTNFSVVESGNYISGALTLTETGTDRYSLINGFNNVSNAVSSGSNGPGDVDYSPFGAPFFVGAHSPYWGHGPAANLNAAASDAAFNELGLQLLHEYCWRRTTYVYVADNNEKPNRAVLKLMREVRPGDLVLCVSDKDPYGHPSWKRVVKCFENEPAELLRLEADDGHFVEPTENHPIQAIERGWVPAGELKPGDLLVSIDRRPVRVKSVTWTGIREPVYNLQVEDFHTYFVSDGTEGFSLLAHNESPGDGARVVGVVFKSANELAAQGVTDYSIDQRQRHGYHFGAGEAHWTSKLGPGEYTVEATTITDETTRSSVDGVKVTNTTTGETWYGVPEVVHTWKDGFYPAQKGVGPYLRSFVESPEYKGTAHVGYTLYNRQSDAEYHISGNDRMKAVESLTPAFGLGGPIAARQAQKVVGGMIERAAEKGIEKLAPAPKYSFGPPLTPTDAQKAAKIFAKSAGASPAGRTSNGSAEGSQAGASQPHQGAAARGYFGVKVTPNGGPDFSGTPYMYGNLNPGQQNTVKIKLQGSYYQDFKESNRLAGFSGAKAPKGYTWHHMDDFNPETGEATMQLVKTGGTRQRTHMPGQYRNMRSCTASNISETIGTDMPLNEFIDTEEPITAAMIDELELRYGFSLPAEVREHYLKYNGGVPIRYLFKKYNSVFIINEFLPIAYGGHLFEESVDALKVDNEVLPSHLVPFAVAPGGDYYCFSVGEKDAGTIWFYVGECADQPDRAVTYLAVSLAEFIEGMVSDEEG